MRPRTTAVGDPHPLVEEFVAAYEQDPIDPAAWEERALGGDCQVSECKRFVLVVTDALLGH